MGISLRETKAGIINFNRTVAVNDDSYGVGSFSLDRHVARCFSGKSIVASLFDFYSDPDLRNRKLTTIGSMKSRRLVPNIERGRFINHSDDPRGVATRQ